MEIQRLYDIEETVYFVLLGYGATDFESTPVTFATGDVKLSKDGGALANTTNLPSHVGLGLYKLVLTSAEMQFKIAAVTIIDAATKTWEDQALILHTKAHASALFPFNVGSVAPDVNVLTMVTAVQDALVDLVWDELDTGHNIPHSMGRLLTQAAHGLVFANGGVVSAGGGNNTMELEAGASSIDDVYLGCGVIAMNNGDSQGRICIGYDGTTKIITVKDDWTVTIDASTEYFVVIGRSQADVANTGVVVGATATGAHQITFQIDDAVPNGVAGVCLSFFIGASLQSVACETDVTGQVIHNLDAGTYNVRQAGDYYTADNPTEVLVVAGDGSVTYTGTTSMPGSNPDPTLCNIFGTIRDGGGNVQAGVTVKAYAIVPQAAQGAQLCNQWVETVTNANGEFILPLTRTSSQVLSIDCGGYKDTLFLVPDSGAQDLATWTPV